MNRTTNRRQFLSDNFASASGFAVAAAFSSLGHRYALGEAATRSSDLVAVKDETTGLPLLRLPAGFRYRTFGWTGDVMTDGVATPSSHDGMGVVKADGEQLTLIRNHEIGDDNPALKLSSGSPYDPYAGGGCTTLKFDSAAGTWLSSRVSMSGTSRNCAGGVTPWGTWLTAEETVLGVGDKDKYKDSVARKFQKSHGWIFEVPADGVGAPEPIEAMGRFVHEAVAIDRETGIVYETEDRGTSGFYRFIPNTPGKLAAGGRLEIAEVIGQPDLRGGFTNGTEFDVRWHAIKDPTLAHTPGIDPADELGVFKQGQKAGGSTFSRLEGCWAGNGVITFDATDGGAAKAGQIWQYNPQTEKLKLIFESPDKPTLNMPDNLCVSPRGGILLCEDNDYGANEYPQRIFGLSQAGQLSLFAENNVQLNGQHNNIKGDFRTKEWAGATFSPDGKWLFVNIQTPGFTVAITGPWQDTLV
ncbi:hypothetical protein FF011L_02170 [Roseimaritima multifibrata]|uniref:Phosphatase n=1 Tax=Roseimaritima multifibrata TaxID=1930274 RepID=A0A517M9M4_9BACT|nr:alkaline phosphatase PhoX [Roseimaritima multifibrata]QDS91487.1 hypothetical protein FF011L_02170 [Roseimaritima multifibrata]